MKNWAIVGLLLVFQPGYGQGIYFNNRYTNDTTAYQSGITSISIVDSGYVAFGQAYDYPFASNVSLLLRGLDQQGNQQWARYYGQPGYDYYSPIFGNGEALRHPDGGFVMAGTVNAPQRQQWPMLWRFTAQGDTLWTRTYRQFPFGAVAYAGCRTADGGYALAGKIGRGSPSGGARGLLIRTDSAGRFQWMQQYGTAPVNEFYSICPTPDGGFLLSGDVWNGQFSPAGIRPFVIKTDALGAVQWQRLFGTPLVQNGGGTARPTRDGGYLVAATLYYGMVQGTPTQQPVFYKLDSLGNQVWWRFHGPARVVSGNAVLHELADGSFVVAGQQCDADSAGTNGGRGYPEGYAMKLCADGDLVWYRTYKKLRGGFSHNYVRDFQPTPDGGFVGAGFLFARAPDTGSNDSWVFKVDSAGYLRPNGPPVTVTCGPLGVGPEALDAGLAAVSVWPNPSADGRFTVGIAAASAASPPASLLKERGAFVVVDALGRRVAAGELSGAETGVDLGRCAPGVYLLRVVWPNGRTLTKKLLR